MSERFFLEKWCKKYYEDQGFKYVTNTDKDKCPNSRYFAIYNDYIIQSEYPEKIANEIDDIYEKADSFESFEVTKLIRLLKEKIDVKVTVMLNPVVAEQLRKHILSHF